MTRLGPAEHSRLLQRATEEGGRPLAGYRGQRLRAASGLMNGKNGGVEGPSREEHELGLARFLAPCRRDRFRSSLANPRARRKLRNRLAHFQDLDERACVSVPALAADSERAWLLRELQASGAPEYCYVVSEDSGLDGQCLELGDALDRVLGFGMGTVISCVPGQLGFFEGEAPRDRWLLRRPE